jgi:transcriptional regulator with XRE-family HTH domain
MEYQTGRFIAAEGVPAGQLPRYRAAVTQPTGSSGESAMSPSGAKDRPPQGRDWLTRTLVELREKTGQSASKAGREAGISQSRMSRIEHGLFLPTEDEVTKLADLYKAPVNTRRRLLRVLKDLRAEEAPARVVMRRGAWRLQRRIATIEEHAAQIDGFAATVVPGLLQTADYARAVFADGGELSVDAQDRAVAERVARSAIIEAGQRQITMIMAEGALRWQAGGPQVMVEQLERLARLAVGKRVRLGVIPWTTRVSVFALHGFNMYDRSVVVIGTRSATAFITDDQDVDAYRTLFDELVAAGSFGADAARIISEIADGYRGLA